MPDPLSAARSYLAERSDKVSVDVYDIPTKKSWSLGPATPQDEASIVKVDVLETLLAQSGSGGLSTSDQTLSKSMIEVSDNNSATQLWDTVGGGPGIAAFNASVGLTNTTPSTCVTCPNFPWPGWGLSTTTPADQVSLLRAIVTPTRC